VTMVHTLETVLNLGIGLLPEYATGAWPAAPALPGKGKQNIISIWVGHSSMLQIHSGLYGDEDAATIDTYFYDQPTTSSRRNPYIVPDDRTNRLKVLSLSELLDGDELFKGFVYPSKADDE
jgi:hypothetical protein